MTLSDYAVSDAGTPTLGRKSSNLLLLLQSQQAYYKKRYGADADTWKKTGTVALLAADLSEGYAKYATMQTQLNTARAQREELTFRGNKLLSTIYSQGKQVQAKQEAAYVKAGVKIEGSALNVMTDTMIQANEMERQKKRELDYQKTQMRIQEAMMETKLKNAPLETLLSMGTSAAMARAM